MRPGTLAAAVRGGCDDATWRVHRQSVAAATFPRRRLYRPIFTQFSAEARRVTRDHAGPFCTMKMRLARVFCDNWSRSLRDLSRRRSLSTLRVRKLDRKEKMTPIHRTASASSNGEPHLRFGRYKTTSGPRHSPHQRDARYASKWCGVSACHQWAVDSVQNLIDGTPMDGRAEVTLPNSASLQGTGFRALSRSQIDCRPATHRSQERSEWQLAPRR
jgi:hypothetical protein